MYTYITPHDSTTQLTEYEILKSVLFRVPEEVQHEQDKRYETSLPHNYKKSGKHLKWER